jgi:hypothetical protein
MSNTARIFWVNMDGTSSFNGNMDKEVGIQIFSVHFIGRPILDYWTACWDPFRKWQIKALDQIEKNKSVQFINHAMESDCKTLSCSRTVTLWNAHFIAYCAERTWEALGYRLQRTSYLSGVERVGKIRDRKERNDIGTHSFVKTVTNCLRKC